MYYENIFLKLLDKIIITVLILLNFVSTGYAFAKSTNEGNMEEVGIKMMFIYFSVFFTTMSLFIYETLLTRLFSAILSHNLVFIVVSLAILGGGIGAVLSYRMLKFNISEKKVLIGASMLLPISFLLSVSIMYFFPFIPAFLIYLPAALIPFILGGVITAVIFTKKSIYSNKLYLADLTGSALGSLLIIKLMNSFGFLRSVIAAGILAVLSAIGISAFYKKGRAVILSSPALLLLSLLFINNEFIEEAGKKFYSYYTSPTTMISRVKYSNAEAEISFSKWDSISKTDVIDIKNRNEKYVVTDGGAAAPIIKFNGNLDSVQEMKSDVNYIPFSFGKNDKSLVIGSGGGKDVIFALLGGSKTIDAVEINPSTIEAVEHFKEYSGDIYNFPGVTLYNQDGRFFIKNSRKKYDNIYMSLVMTNSIENNMYSLAEYYIFTEEAFREYFDHLADNGKLAFKMHDRNELMKIVNTGIKVLMDRGVKDREVTDYFVVVNGITEDMATLHGDEIAMPLVIFKNTPFTENEIKSIENTANNQNRVLLHSRGKEAEPYKSLKSGAVTLKEIIRKNGPMAEPITDDSPFFYDNSRFIPVQMAFIIIIILQLWIVIRKRFLTNPDRKRSSIYFASLGMAFMLVEIPIIQKMVLYFGSSSIAFSFVVFSLLVSSGIGSLASGTRVVEKLTAKAPYYLLGSGIAVIAVQLGLNPILRLSMNLETIYKFFIVFFSLFPMGFLMGMAYPTGIKRLGRNQKDGGLIPLMCGVNAIFSVLGSTLAVVFAMKLGFNATVYVGAVIYIMLFILNPLGALEEERLR